MDYQPFELRISGSFAAGFTVQALGPSGSSSEVPVAMPWTAAELETLTVVLGEEAAGKRRGDTGASRVDVEAFGAKLFDAFFPKSVDREFRLAVAQGGADRVRIRIQLNAPELVDVPWEFLYDTHEERFLVLSSTTPVVRTFNLPTPSRTPISPEQLNVLVMVAGGDGLAAEQEFAQLADAVDADGDVRLARVPAPTLTSLQETLSQGEYHAFHFIGHGRYDDRDAEGVLWLEDEGGTPVSVTAGELTTHLGDHPSMRLVVLNACEGARTSVADPTSGLAQALFRGGVEVVIAMQYEITDANALAFSRKLYRGLARRDPVEHAVTEARKAIPGPSREWATPVVFMRLADGRLFAEQPEGRRGPEVVTDAPAPQPLAAAAPTAPPAPSTGGRRGLLIGAVVAVVAAAVIGVLALSGGGDDDTETVADLIEDATTTSTTTAPTTTSTTTTEAPVADDPGDSLDFYVPADEPQREPFEGAQPWWSLDTDQCIDPLQEDTGGYAGRYWVAPISCALADVQLAYNWFKYDLDTDLVTFGADDKPVWPGADAVVQAGREICEEDLAFTDLENPVEEIVVLAPLEDEWVEGELFDFICLVPYNVS